MPRVKDFGVGFETIHSLRQIEYVRRAEEMGFGTAWVPWIRPVTLLGSASG